MLALAAPLVCYACAFLAARRLMEYAGVGR